MSTEHTTLELAKKYKNKATRFKNKYTHLKISVSAIRELLYRTYNEFDEDPAITAVRLKKAIDMLDDCLKTHKDES